MHFRYFRMPTGRFDELLRRIQPLGPEKATAGKYVLSGPITALTARVNATWGEVHVWLRRRGPRRRRRYDVTQKHKLGLSQLSPNYLFSHFLWLSLTHTNSTIHKKCVSKIYLNSISSLEQPFWHEEEMEVEVRPASMKEEGFVPSCLSQHWAMIPWADHSADHQNTSREQFVFLQQLTAL